MRRELGFGTVQVVLWALLGGLSACDSGPAEPISPGAAGGPGGEAGAGGELGAGGAGGQAGGAGVGGGAGVAPPDFVGELLWGRGAGAQSAERIEAIAADASGGAVLVGGFQTSMQWGGDLLTSAGGSDVVVVKLDAVGEHVWSRGFGDGLDQVATAVAVDGHGDIVVVGEFGGTMSFGEGPDASITSAGGKDLFVAKLDASGNHLWSRAYGDGHDQYATAVTITAGGDIVVVGMFDGTIAFGDDPAAAHAGEGPANVVVARLDADGDHLWSKSFGGPESWQRFRSVVSDAATVYLSGAFAGIVALDGKVVESAVDGWTGGGGAGGSGGGAGGGGGGGGDGEAIYGVDGLVVALELETGKLAWARPLGAAGEQYAKFVGLGLDGNPVVLGNYLSSFDVGATPIEHPDGGGYNLYLAQLGADTGEPLAARGFPAAGDQFVWGFDRDPWGNHVLGGYFTEALELGAPPIPITDGSYGDAFVCKLAAGFGDALWTRVLRDGFYSHATAQAVAADGRTIAAGLFYGDALEVGAGLPPIQHSEQDGPGANGDVFVVGVSP